MARLKMDNENEIVNKPQKEITLIDYIATLKLDTFKKNTLLSKYNSKYGKDLNTINVWKTIIIQ